MEDASPTLRPVLVLAGPVLLEQLLHLSVASMARRRARGFRRPMWLAGRVLETPHLAAMGLIWYVLWLIPSLFAAISIGATAIIARLIGAQRHGEAVHVANQAMVIDIAVRAALVLGRFWQGGWSRVRV